MSKGREEPWGGVRTDHSRIEAIAIAKAYLGQGRGIAKSDAFKEGAV